jgi:cobalt/nickel transport system ATP-binding protein
VVSPEPPSSLGANAEPLAQASSAQVILQARDLTFAYQGRHPALEHVSIDIRANESVVILGANGSGKSTLLKVLDGLYFPSAGTVHAWGEPLTEASLRVDEFNFAFRRRVGLVFQDSDVQLFSASVLDELAFAPLQLGIPREEVTERVAAALSALRIESLRLRAPHHLSGGEKRRVALGSLLTLQPEVWLLDEPAAGLDPRSQSWLIEFIQEQRRLGKTIVTATHDLSLAEEVASIIHVFSEDHRLIASGAPSDILGDHDLLHQCNLYHYHAHQPHSASGN